MLSESLTIGLLLVLVFGALFFYLYSRVTYSEKRIGLIEKMLLNLKMEQEEKPIHMPVFPRPPPQMTFHNLTVPPMPSMPPMMPPQPMPSEPSEPFVPSLPPAEEEQPIKSEEEENQNILEEAYVPQPPSEDDAVPKIEVNYEAMTKDELVEVAKTKGIRVGNRPGREKLLQLLKKSSELEQNT